MCGHAWLLPTQMLRRAGQGNVLGATFMRFDVPEGWASDSETGKPVTTVELAPCDVLAVAGALGLATTHLVTQDWSLNNLMACLIASDILQLVSGASCPGAVSTVHLL